MSRCCASRRCRVCDASRSTAIKFCRDASLAPPCQAFAGASVTTTANYLTMLSGHRFGHPGIRARFERPSGLPDDASCNAWQSRQKPFRWLCCGTVYQEPRTVRLRTARYARLVRRRLGSGAEFLLDRFGKEAGSSFCTCAHGYVAKIAGLQFCLRVDLGGSRTTRKTLSRTSPVWVLATTGGDHPFAGERHPQ